VSALPRNSDMTKAYMVDYGYLRERLMRRRCDSTPIRRSEFLIGIKLSNCGVWVAPFSRTRITPTTRLWTE
jgi:hypothetical protein